MKQPFSTLNSIFNNFSILHFKPIIFLLYVFFISSVMCSAAFCQKQPVIDFTIKQIGDKNSYTFESSFTLKDSSRIFKTVYPNSYVDEDHVVYDEYKMILRKKTASGFEKVDVAGLIHPSACYDTIILNPNVSLKDTLFVDLFYQLVPGEYKLKVIRKIYYDLKEMFIESKWLSFYVTEPPKY